MRRAIPAEGPLKCRLLPTLDRAGIAEGPLTAKSHVLSERPLGRRKAAVEIKQLDVGNSADLRATKEGRTGLHESFLFCSLFCHRSEQKGIHNIAVTTVAMSPQDLPRQHQPDEDRFRAILPEDIALRSLPRSRQAQGWP